MVGRTRSGLRWKELDVGLGGAAEIENAASEERYIVAGAAGRHDLPAGSRVGVARDELLRFPDGGPDRADVKSGGDRRLDAVGRQFDAAAVGQIVGRRRSAEVDGVAFMA